MISSIIGNHCPSGFIEKTNKKTWLQHKSHFNLCKQTWSRVAQWKRAGPITQRSVDRNYALLSTFFKYIAKIHSCTCILD